MRMCIALSVCRFIVHNHYNIFPVFVFHLCCCPRVIVVAVVVVAFAQNHSKLSVLLFGPDRKVVNATSGLITVDQNYTPFLAHSHTKFDVRPKWQHELNTKMPKRRKARRNESFLYVWSFAGWIVHRIFFLFVSFSLKKTQTQSAKSRKMDVSVFV